MKWQQVSLGLPTNTSLVFTTNLSHEIPFLRTQHDTIDFSKLDQAQDDTEYCSLWTQQRHMLANHGVWRNQDTSMVPITNIINYLLYSMQQTMELLQYIFFW